MPWKPLDETDLFPTLGWLVSEQMTEFLGRPDAGDEEQDLPFVPTVEQQEILNELYRLDPVSGRRLRHRSVIQRPRGWGKSPFVAGIMIAEAMFDVVPDGWDADGQPVAKPWSVLRTPYVAIAAVTEEQTRNTWGPLLEMIRNGSAVDEFGCDPMDSFVALRRGRIQPITASPNSIKGFKAVAASLDQTETWVPSNSGVKLAQTLRNNATKLGGVTVETPNAYTPGERSVAEDSARFFEYIKSGKYAALEDVDSLFYTHREAPPSTDVTDRDSLVSGLRVAYGDAAAGGCVLHDPPCPDGWVDLRRVADDFFDTSNDPQVMRADFLNQITHASDSWMSQPEVNGAVAVKTVTSSEPVTLGFDGGEGRKQGVADSTVLIGFSVQQQHLFELGVWEQPKGWDSRVQGPWRPPVPEVDAAVDDAFRKFNIVGFFADPSAGWSGNVKAWESKYHNRLKVQVTRDEPIRWKQRDVTRTTDGFEALRAAIVQGDVTLDGSRALVGHFLNARRDPRRSGYVVKKPDDDQDYAKVDAAWGSMFAFAAGLEAVGKGVLLSRKTVPRRIY